MAAWRRVWIERREFTIGARFHLRWIDDEGRVRSEAVGPQAREAENRRRAREHEINRGDVHSPEVNSEASREVRS